MSVEREAIITAARSWIGTAYHHQASLRHIGCDCLGLLRGVWREVIGPEPELIAPYSAGWMSVVRKEILLEALDRHFQRRTGDGFLSGDILVFRFRKHLPASHIGIATSQTSMVHAHSGACVAEVPISDHWRRRLTATLSFPGLVN